MISVLNSDGAPQTIATVDDLIAIVGTATASPAANTLQDRLKQIHTDLATTLAAYVDGLETGQATAAAKLDTLHVDIATTLAGYVDGLEALIGTTNTGNTALGAKLDILHTDLATTLAGYVDGLEALIGTTNTGNAALGTKLDTVHTDVATTLHGDIVSTNTKLDTLHTDITATKATAGQGATGAAVPSGATQSAGKAVSAEETATTAGFLRSLVTDLVGKLIVLPYANPENFVSGAITTAMTGTTDASLVAAPGAGLRNYITQITVSNSHATVGTDVVIKDGAAGAVLYTIPAAAAYGGAVITLPTPLRQPTANTALYAANLTTGASTKVSASGYKGA